MTAKAGMNRNEIHAEIALNEHLIKSLTELRDESLKLFAAATDDVTRESFSLIIDAANKRIARLRDETTFKGHQLNGRS
jgi:hypothetical protein